jgi:SAM-dependent methyltransferase
MSCPLCGAAASETLDVRPRVPVAQNLLFPSREAALGCPVGTLHMVRCLACGFAWNAEFDPALVGYGADYENDQTHSPFYRRHFDAVASEISRRTAGEAVDVLEIGCGQGAFLGAMAGSLGPSARRLTGFDPAFRGGELPAGCRIEAAYFTGQRLEAKQNLVVARHVIEHVADPVAFLRTLRGACADGALVAIETPDVQWILDGAVVHDLYYEHCSLFDAPSLALALWSAGFAVETVESCFGGQYLLAIARAAAPGPRPERADPVDSRGYAARREEWVVRARAALRREAAAGHRIALWGAASKGVTLALLVQEEDSPLALAIDISPARAGTFMPLTGLPVVAPEEARWRGVTRAFLMNPAYADEIDAACRAQGWDLALSPVEFLTG